MRRPERARHGLRLRAAGPKDDAAGHVSTVVTVVRWLPLAVLVGSCAAPALAPPNAASKELVTIAAVGGRDALWKVLGEPIARGRHYAVVDDRGYVGTLRADSTMPCVLACVGCCSEPEWTTKWIDPPLRARPEGLVLAIGPVDGRYASARRELPMRIDPDGNPWAWSFVGSDEPRTLARFSFAGEPDALEARGSRVDGARVIELRVRDRGTWRVVSRTVDESASHGSLD